MTDEPTEKLVSWQDHRAAERGQDRADRCRFRRFPLARIQQETGRAMSFYDLHTFPLLVEVTRARAGELIVHY